MTIRDAGRGTGRLSEDAVKKAAMEAAKRAAEASMRAAAEAAARREAAEAAKRATTTDLQRHTGRLQAGAGADFGNMPWEEAAGAVGTLAAVGSGVAAVTQSTAYQAVKDTLSVKKKVEDIQKTYSQVSTTVAAVRESGGSIREAMEKLSAPKPPSVRPLDTLGKVNGVIRVTGGVQSAFNLARDIESFKDGVTLKEATSAAGNGLNVLRGADEAVKLVRGTTAGVLGRLAPGVSIAASSVDAVRRINNLTNWNELSTKDKISNVAYLLGDAADIAGNFFPPAKAVAAGLSLVGMAAENWDTLSQWGSQATALTGRVAGAVVDNIGEAASNAVDAVKDTAKDLVEGAKERVGKIAEGVRNIFGGL